MMRCPNASCRQVFEVREVTPPAPPNGPASAPPSEGGEAIITGIPVEEPAAAPAFPPQKSGRVQDMVPLLGAEVAGPPEPDWRTAPPPQRGAAAAPEPKAAPARPRTPVPEPPRRGRPAAPARAEDEPREAPPPRSRPQVQTVPVEAEEPEELQPGDWEAPPVRRPGDSAVRRGKTQLEAERVAARRTRRNRLFLVGIVLLPLAVLGTAGGLVIYWVSQTENRLAEQAQQEYDAGQFAQAAETYRILLEKFPDSPQKDDYQFHQELSEVRGLANTPDTAHALDEFGQFVKRHEDDPRLKDQGPDLAKTFAKLHADAVEAINVHPEDKELRTLLDKSKEVQRQLVAAIPGALPKSVEDEVAAADESAHGKIRQTDERQDLLDQLRALAARPSIDSVKDMRRLLKKQAAGPHPLDKDPDVVALEDQVYANHLNSVTFAADPVPLPATDRGEDRVPSVVVVPRVEGEGQPSLPDRVILALVRGVLYALDQRDGSVVWTMRVGIDTTNLPVRLPAAGGRPEMVLVLSADTLTLTALNARTGDGLWKYRLSAPCLGRPVVVDQRAYVPTYDGQIHEIELAEGSLLGRYHLGQRLTSGGSRLEGTRLVFFPADDYCVYALDVGERRCKAILYSEHLASSLRGAPVVIPTEDPRAAGQPDAAPAGFLVLTQTDGFGAMELRTFQLPIQGPREGPAMAEPLRLGGWSWFPPYRDPEKLLLATDAGQLGLFGIKQPQNQDSPLFPLVRVKGQPPGVVDLAGSEADRGTSQVVHALENDLWVLARGRLQRQRLTLEEKDGPRAIPDPRWQEPLPLGSPVHESQMDEAGTTLFLVTQPLHQQTCLATAVDAETGKVRWQRQLGLVCHDEPLVMGGEVLALDQGGGLFLFDQAKEREHVGDPWQSRGQSLAAPLPETAPGSLYLLRAPDGQSAYEVACPAPGNRVLIRHYAPGRPAAREHEVPVTARLAGTPAVGAKYLLLPLADASVVRVPLPLDERETLAAPDWRASKVNTEARGHLVWLGGDDFLMTNGHRGMTRYRFEDTLWRSLPEGRNAREPSVELRERIAAAPVVVPGGDGKLRVCVADAAGTLHLFEGDDFKEVRHWDLHGRLASGPFLQGGKVGCVIDRGPSTAEHRPVLVWLDPGKDRPLWEHAAEGAGEVVGQPQLIEGLLVVADDSGRFVGLDPATGKPQGPGYTLKASVVPTASPVAFGPGRAFAPLSDGTVLLLPLDQLRPSRPWFRPVW
jgi:outer membrane protein assembly factor BamB